MSQTTGDLASAYSPFVLSNEPDDSQTLLSRLRAKIIEEEAGAILERLRGSTNGHAPKAAAAPASKPARRVRSAASRAKQAAAMRRVWKRKRAAKAK